MKTRIATVALIGLTLVSARAQKVDSSLSFFITSKAIGKGADLGGLAGADAHCLDLASKAGATHKVWKAYLSTQATTNTTAINARDRIGSGPWFNAKKVMVATSVSNLHSSQNHLGIGLSLTETGDTIPYTGAASRHDMLTGSDTDGTALGRGGDSTCSNWTSDKDPGGAQVGHYNKGGGGLRPTSWNSAHMSYGCSNAKLVSSNCGGLFYCFATDATVGLQDQDRRREPRTLGKYVIAEGFQGTGREVAFAFELQEAADIEVRVVSPGGKVVATLAKGRMLAGAREVRWSGPTGKGSGLSAGIYLIQLILR